MEERLQRRARIPRHVKVTDNSKKANKIDNIQITLLKNKALVKPSILSLCNSVSVFQLSFELIVVFPKAKSSVQKRKDPQNVRRPLITATGTTRKNEPTIFLPSGVHTKPKPKTNPETKPNPWISFLGFVLGFVLEVYSVGQKYCWLIFLVVPVI